MHWLRIGCVVILSGLSVAPALSGSATGLMAVLRNCQNPDRDPDIRIDMCSQMIRANIASHGIKTAFYAMRASAYADKKDFDHALQDYDKAIELKPDFPEAFANRAATYERMGDFAHATADHERAGFFHMKKDQCKEAIGDYNAALERDPKLSLALYGRGLCRQRLGNAAAGQADIQAALGVDSGIESRLDWPKK